MGIYQTESGYVVKETISGLDVYDDVEMEVFVCELSGMSLDHFRYDGDIDDDKLHDAIKEELEVEDIIAMSADY